MSIQPQEGIVSRYTRWIPNHGYSLLEQPARPGGAAIMMNDEIKAHYASPGLYERIVQGLEAIGKSPASVDLDDLASLDGFHFRGPAATRELIEILDVGADSHVLDVGSGLGGPARRLAKATGCRVAGVDLSEDYCAVGNELFVGVPMPEQSPAIAKITRS